VAGWAPEPAWTLWRREKSFISWNETHAVQPLARMMMITINKYFGIISWGNNIE
jgi:hypothetical protein